MRNGIFILSKENIKSAIVYAIIWGVLSILIHIQGIGSIYNVDWSVALDTGVIAVVAFVVTIFKNTLTTNEGNFLGIAKVIPDNE